MVSPWTKSEGIFIQNGSKYRNSIKYEHITINHNAHYFHVNLRMFLDPFSRISSFTCNTITWMRKFFYLWMRIPHSILKYATQHRLFKYSSTSSAPSATVIIIFPFHLCFFYLHSCIFMRLRISNYN